SETASPIAGTSPCLRQPALQERARGRGRRRPVRPKLAAGARECEPSVLPPGPSAQHVPEPRVLSSRGRYRPDLGPVHDELRDLEPALRELRLEGPRVVLDLVVGVPVRT